MQEAVHLVARLHVGADFLDDTLLCSGEFEGQVVVEEVVEMFANGAEDDAFAAELAVLHVAQDVELHVEEFFELETELRKTEGFGRRGVVDVAHGLVVGHEVVLRHNVGGEGLLQRVLQEFEQVGGEFRHACRGESAPLHLLRGVVSRSKPLEDGGLSVQVLVLQVGVDGMLFKEVACGAGLLKKLRWCLLYFGVSYLDAPIKHSGFAENDIRCSAVVMTGSIFDALKPYKVDEASPVGEVGDEAFGPSFSHAFERHNLSTQLHVGHVAVNVAYLINPAAIHILIGVVGKQVAHGLNAEFVGKQGGPVGTYALQILDVLTEDVHLPVSDLFE